MPYYRCKFRTYSEHDVVVHAKDEDEAGEVAISDADDFTATHTDYLDWRDESYVEVDGFIKGVRKIDLYVDGEGFGG